MMPKIASWVILFFLFLCLFYPATATNVCPKGKVSFTCESERNTSAFTWAVTPYGGNATTCVALKSPPSVTEPTCGPNDEFSVSISGDGSNSTLSTQSVDKSLNETEIECIDGDINQTICVIDVLESANIQSATVSGIGEEENMCQLRLEWSEAIVSCDGDVSYNVTVIPCLSGPTPVRIFSTNKTQQILDVNGSVGLKYSSTLTSEACNATINSNIAYGVDLTAKGSGNESFYFYSYNGTTVEAINVTWPRYYILNEEAAYRVVIDDKIVKNVTAQNCSGDMCNSVYCSNSLTSSSIVAVEIVGCVTERINSSNITERPPPKSSGTGGLSCGAIAGIVIGIIAAVAL